MIVVGLAGSYETPPAVWQDQAACRGADPALFFPDRDDREAIAEAKTYCAACEVRVKCLSYALTTKIEHGIFGGLDADERRKQRRRPDPRLWEQT